MSLYDQLVALKPSILQANHERDEKQKHEKHQAIVKFIGEDYRARAIKICGGLKYALEEKSLSFGYHVSAPFSLMFQTFDIFDYTDVLIELLKTTDELKRFTRTPVMDPPRCPEKGMYIKVSW